MVQIRTELRSVRSEQLLDVQRGQELVQEGQHTKVRESDTPSPAAVESTTNPVPKKKLSNSSQQASKTGIQRRRVSSSEKSASKFELANKTLTSNRPE